MTRTVRDSAYLLAAIAGPDPADNYTSAIPFAASNASNTVVLPDYVAACKLTGLQGMRIGVSRDVMALYAPLGGVPETDLFEEALYVLREAGATIVETGTEFLGASQKVASDVEMVVLGAGLITGLARYLAQLTVNPANVTSLADVRDWTHAHGKGPESFPDRNTALWDRALGIGLQPGQEGGFNVSDPRFWTAYNTNYWFGDEGGLLGVLRRAELDALVMPTSFSSTWAATAGSPIITVPMGFYPPDAEVRLSARRHDLVDTAPNIPYVQLPLSVPNEQGLVC